MSNTLDSINSRLDTAEDYWTWNTATETIQKKQGKKWTQYQWSITTLSSLINIHIIRVPEGKQNWSQKRTLNRSKKLPKYDENFKPSVTRVTTADLRWVSLERNVGPCLPLGTQISGAFLPFLKW